MKQDTSLILALEVGAASVLIAAALQGDAALHSNGLHVRKLAYEHIGLAVFAVSIISCILAAAGLARVARSWDRMEAWGFLASVLVGCLAASAFANASGRVTIFGGASTEWISWPVTLWLLGLTAAFAVRACDARRQTDELAEPADGTERRSPFY
jgi:hypothetical protein